MAEEVKEQQVEDREFSQEEIGQMRKEAIEHFQSEIEYLKVRAEYEELLAKIEMAQRDRMVAFRDKVILKLQQQQAEEEAKKQVEEGSDKPTRTLKTK